MVAGAKQLGPRQSLDTHLRRLTFHLAAEQSGAGLLRGVYFYTVGRMQEVQDGFWGVPEPVESLNNPNAYKVAILRTGSQRGTMCPLSKFAADTI